MIEKKQSKSDNFFYEWKEFRFAQLILIALYFFISSYLRFQYRWSHPLDGDELMTIQGLRMDFYSMLFDFIPKTDFHFPPAYVLLYPIGHYLSMAPLIVSAPYAVLSLYFYYFFARVNWPKIVGFKNQRFAIDVKWINVLACVLISYNDTLIIHALVLRPYALLCPLALLALWLADKILNLKNLNWRYVVAVLALLLFHNFGSLMMLTAFGYCLLSRISQAEGNSSLSIQIKSYAPAFLTVGLAVLLSVPFFWWYLQYPFLHQYHFSSIDPHLFIHPGMRGIIQVWAIYYGLSQPHLKPFRLILVVFVACTIPLFFRQKKWMVLGFLFVFVICPTWLIYLFDLRLNYWFVQRQFIWAIPFHAVFVAMSIHYLLNTVYLRVFSHTK